MLIIMDELEQREGANIANNKPVTCYELFLKHDKNYYPSYGFATLEAGKQFAEDHAKDNSRLKLHYGIIKGTLQGNYFRTDCHSFRVIGMKEGQVINW